MTNTSTSNDAALKLFASIPGHSTLGIDVSSLNVISSIGASSLLNFSSSSDDSSNNISPLMQSGGDDSAGEEPSFNLRLIEAVRQSRCLYDASDRQYRSADHKIKVWNRLVQVLGFQGDARTLYNRWKQLRDKYGKEKKKIKYNGDMSQWQFFKHLEFLDPHMVDRIQQKFERTKDGKFIETNRPIMINDPGFALKLVNDVRRHPCLFDIRDAKYRQTEHRNQVWTDIIKRLNFPGDINAIYKQWKKIRDRYVREKRKMRMSASGEHEEPTWELFQELTWIDPYLEERATFSQVKRKRESSEISDDLFANDFSLRGRLSDSQQTQQYTMVMPSSSGQALAGANPAQVLQQLANATKLHTQPVASPTLQARQIRPGAGLSSSSAIVGSTAAILSNGTTLMMQPLLAQNVATHLTTSHSGQQPAHHQLHPQLQPPHVIVAAAPAGANSRVDGDRAYALSVAADLSALPDHARNMARAQIQHLLENSKITIVKA